MKKGMLLGIAIGDAIGVPYEFNSREKMAKNPATDMIGYGTHNQPVGTWSDDSSLAFCLAENIGNGFDLEKLADSFIRWKNNAYMTANNEVFDIGVGTFKSINNLMNRKHNQVAPENCGLNGYGDNGNGSVMRILPLAWYIYSEMFNKGRYVTIMERYKLVKKVSGLTHGHEISVIASHLLIEFALHIIDKKDVMNINDIWEMTRVSYSDFIKHYEDKFNVSSLNHFKRILSSEFTDFSMKYIYGSGFAVHTVEASIWCLINTNNYKDCVLKAVNLGEDTDTTAAVAGGLAGIIYGEEGIPQKWKEKILKKDLIYKLEIQMLKL